MGFNKEGPVLVVTGTRREAALLRGRGLIVLAGGGQAEALAQAIDAEIESHGGVAGILSYGMAGALVRGVHVGHVIIGTEVDGAVAAPCDPDWLAALARALPDARRAPVYADGRLLATRAAKAKVRAVSPGAAVDMESHVAAAAALRHGLPLAVLRVISDPHNVSLPPAVEVAMGDGGELAVGAMLGSLLRQPSQLFALIATLRQFARGFAVLKAVTRQLNARLEFDRRGEQARPARKRRKPA